MISNKILPAHILRLYTWELLRENVGLEKVGDLIPVIPLGEEPELADSGKDYLVYGYAEQSALKPKEVKRGTFSLRICTRTFATLGHISNTLERAFENGDWSAAEVNLWSTAYPTDLKGIRFTDLDVTYIEGGDVPRLEGGYFEGLVNISYSYITHQKVKVFTNNGWA